RDRRPRRRRLRRPAAGRGDHERDAQPGPEEEHRALPDRGPAPGARLGGRGREARRPAEADPGDGRADPVLRPGQDAPPLVGPVPRRIVLCMPESVTAHDPNPAETARRDVELAEWDSSPAGVVGFAEGGWRALELAAQRPDLVDQLVLVSTPVQETDDV